ncbi:MAG: Uma2 family endonuclease [Acetobacteraceae bacterium]|nr:Uma2 family endonuclease [Acetobacteraceae bacterium]
MSAFLKPLTLDEFLDWERDHPERFEFDGIQPVAMTRGSVAHARLVRRLVAVLTERARPECEVFGGDLKVLTAGRARYPDVTIVCGATEPSGDTVEPSVIIEVLSPSTALTDRRVKPAEYASLPTLLVYAMLEPDQPRAVVLRRSNGWREEGVSGLDSVLPFPELNVKLPLALLYD